MKRGAITAVCYLNTLPFVFGINRVTKKLHDELLLAIPSECAANFINNLSDIALIPAADLLLLDSYQIITDFCIGATDFVRTVVLMSNFPLSQIDTIYLDSHSHTSAALVEILCREYWKIEPKFAPLTKYDTITESSSNEKAAYLLIGDKVFNFEGKFSHTYDLAHEWRCHTGMPFVFAVWVAKKELSPLRIKELEEALRYGVEHIEDALEWSSFDIDKADGVDYLQNSIDFELNSEKRAALAHYLQKIPPSPKR